MMRSLLSYCNCCRIIQAEEPFEVIRGPIHSFIR